MCFGFGSDLGPAVCCWDSECLCAILNNSLCRQDLLQEPSSWAATNRSITVFANGFSFPLKMIKRFFWKNVRGKFVFAFFLCLLFSVWCQLPLFSPPSLLESRLLLLERILSLWTNPVNCCDKLMEGPLLSPPRILPFHLEEKLNSSFPLY